MFFITNYTPKDGIDSKKRLSKDSRFEFNYSDDDPGISTYFCERKAEGEYKEIEYSEFFDELRKKDVKTILIFIHGYNNKPETALKKAIELQKLIDEKKPNEALVLPFIWPCSCEGLLSGYILDRRKAKPSGVALTRTIEWFYKWIMDRKCYENPCTKKISILAHSMGNRVLEFALEFLEEDTPNPPSFIKNSFLAAADIHYKTLEDKKKGRLISDLSKNVVVYYAKDDKPLIASSCVGWKGKRLGKEGPRDLYKCDKNVYSVDCNRINDCDETTSHNYLESKEFINHLFSCLNMGKIKSNKDKTYKL